MKVLLSDTCGRSRETIGRTGVYEPGTAAFKVMPTAACSTGDSDRPPTAFATAVCSRPSGRPARTRGGRRGRRCLGGQGLEPSPRPQRRGSRLPTTRQVRRRCPLGSCRWLHWAPASLAERGRVRGYRVPFAVAGQVPQSPDRRGRRDTPSQQSMLGRLIRRAAGSAQSENRLSPSGDL